MYYAELQQLNIDTRGQFSGLIKTICPQCASSRKKQGDPSLSVNIDTGLYKCHHCGWKGSVAGKTYTVPEPRKEDPDGKISNYFEARGISADTMRHFRVTQGKELMPQDGQYHRVICFNYYQDGFLVNIKFKTSDKKFKMVSGARKIPYNLNAIKESDVVIICEGEEETMVWHEAGFPFAVSCPNGASDKTNNLEWLDATYNYFENKKIVLATDNDAPGKKLREDLSRRFDIDNIYVIDFIDGCKDANDVLLAYGKETLQDLFNNAKPLPVKEIAEVGDFLAVIEKYHDHGYPKGDTIGFTETDELLSWSRGELVTVTGVPGCFSPDQLIHTKRGVIPISEVLINDFVLSYNEKLDLNEWRKVIATPIHPTTKDKMFKITLKDGTVIKVTENHEFFTEVGYRKIKDILLSLKNGKNLEKDTGV
jgi:twinkle protein